MCVHRTLLLLACLFAVFCSGAQQIQKITEAQYFFDEDSGINKAKPLKIVTSDTSVSIVDSIAASSLQPGFHTLCIRVKNNLGKWSILESRSFYVADGAVTQPNIAKITAAQYFFDEDSGINKAKPLTIKTSDTSVTIKDSISAASLKPGFHTLCIRVKNSTGRWSILESRSFYVADSSIAQPTIAKIVAAQYFFDEDSGVNKAKPLKINASDTSVNIVDSIPASTLKPGFHTLCIRVKNTTGKWSILESRSFYVADSAVAQPNIAKITAAQYFFDEDPGISKSIALKIKKSDTTVNINDSIAAASLKPGFHTLCIRVKNSTGKWSILETRSFYVADTSVTQPNIAKITAAEYFFDKDPGAGKGSVLQVPTVDTVVNFNDSISSGILPGRDHILTIRVKNKWGRWSILESRNFSYSFTDKDRDGLVDYEEPFYSTDPFNFDTNGDYLADGVNVFTGLKPLSKDTDGDGISNTPEILNGTSPILKDTDGDGLPDNKDSYPLDRFRSAPPPKNAADHTPPTITLFEPF